MKSHQTAPARRRFFSHFLPLSVFAVGLVIAPVFCLLHADAKQLPETDLTVHEWGTFTSIAGPDGTSMDWLPLTGSTDLPSFVEHFREVAFKGGLRGTVRMETPVLYFYSPRETTVSVNVSFAKGLITEWYPRANAVNPALTPRDFSLFNMKSSGSIAWNSVHIEPQGSTDFPTDNSDNHYFAARNTSAASLSVETPSGPQREKFLFYRGVSAFSVPINATVTADSTIHLQNQLSEEIPAAILFERRGAQIRLPHARSPPRSGCLRSSRTLGFARFPFQQSRGHPHLPGPLPRRSPRHARNLEKLLVRRRLPPHLYRSPPFHRFGPPAPHHARASNDHPRLRRPPRTRHSRHRTRRRIRLRLQRSSSPSPNTTASLSPSSPS